MGGQFQKKTGLCSPTFLQGLGQFDVAVRALELVEEGPHFELVGGSVPEAGHYCVVFPLGSHLKHGPVPPWLPFGDREPVHHLVALDVLRLLLDLEVDHINSHSFTCAVLYSNGK